MTYWSALFSFGGSGFFSLNRTLSGNIVGPAVCVWPAACSGSSVGDSVLSYSLVCPASIQTTMSRSWANSQILSVATILSAVFSLHYIGSWHMVMSDYSGWLPFFGVCPRLHSNFGSKLKFFHVLTCMTVVVFLLVFFGLLEILRDFFLVVTCWLTFILNRPLLLSLFAGEWGFYCFPGFCFSHGKHSIARKEIITSHASGYFKLAILKIHS